MTRRTRPMTRSTTRSLRTMQPKLPLGWSCGKVKGAGPRSWKCFKNFLTSRTSLGLKCAANEVAYEYIAVAEATVARVVNRHRCRGGAARADHRHVQAGCRSARQRRR